MVGSAVFKKAHMTRDAAPPADAVWRAFVALALDEALRQQLAALQDEFKRADDGIRWVAPEGLHLTLVFIGDVFGAQTRALADGLQAACAQHAAFTCALQGVGTFDNPQAPRVIWVGLQDPQAHLARLQAACQAAVVAAGARPDAKPFHAHITLGRARHGRRNERLMTRLAAAHDRPLGAMAVAQAHLMRSQLTPGGPLYTPLAACPLAPKTTP